ncbi:hypothetical protein STBA_57170 [Streptomyces sp. MP131-18]|nr:hypothetical protein STBA_57170 [Streptomyces sp. MP131-18]
MTRRWDGPLGAVRPLEAPSWLTALPRITASTWCPLRRASDRRSSSRTPAPSLQPVPLASAEYERQRPSGESPRCSLNSMNVSGVAMMLMPPASASVHSPERRDCDAHWSATSDEEQAVSTVTAGPSRPSV